VTTRSSRQVVLEIYEAMAARDMASFLRLVHPDFAITEPPWLPYGGTHVGIEAVLDLFRQILEQFEVSRLELRSLTADGERLWTQFVVPARVTGHDVLVAEEWRVVDGRAQSVRVWFDDPSPLRLGPAEP
jgi:ketosteroid isomerase-like protein